MFLVRCCRFKRNSLILFLLVWTVVLLKISVIAQPSVTLSWNPSSGPDAAGYNIYYSMESHVYTAKVSAGNGTNVTITGLIEGATYYFAATTYDFFGQESSFSEEVAYPVPMTTVNPPVTNSIVVGQNVILNVAAGGTGQLSYYWMFDSTGIPSATNGTLTLNNFTTNQAGAYSVTVSDDTGLVTNITVFLAVYLTAAATLTQADFTGGLFSFNVSGVPGFEYIVQASTNLVDWDSVQTNVAPFTFADPAAGEYSRRMYRTLCTNGSTASLTVDATMSARMAPVKIGRRGLEQF